MKPASPYASRPLETDAASLIAYRSLLGVTFGAFDGEYLQWLYCDNPRGAAFGYNAYAGDDLIAHYATIPVDATIDGAHARGLLSLNTATHPAHQGKGLFTRLADQTYARAHDLGYEFVVGVANANSTPGFTRKLGFQLVAPLDVLVGIGRLAASDDPQIGFAVAWDDSALAWRLRRPHAQYVATRGEQATVYSHTHRRGVLAYMTRAPRSLAAALPAPRITQPVRMWIGLDAHLERRGVLARLPDRFKPSPLNLIFRDLTARQRRLDRDTTRFTLLDFDAY